MSAATAPLAWGCRRSSWRRRFWITLVLVIWLLLGPLAPGHAANASPPASPPTLLAPCPRAWPQLTPATGEREPTLGRGISP